MARTVQIAVSSLLLLSSAALAKPDVAAGKAIYTQNCQGCHGAQGEGQVGPKLAGDAAKWSFALFKRSMLKNVDDKGVALKPPMPLWGRSGFGGSGKVPTDAQIQNLHAYLKTLKGK